MWIKQFKIILQMNNNLQLLLEAARIWMLKCIEDSNLLAITYSKNSLLKTSKSSTIEYQTKNITSEHKFWREFIKRKNINIIYQLLSEDKRTLKFFLINGLENLRFQRYWIRMKRLTNYLMSIRQIRHIGWGNFTVMMSKIVKLSRLHTKQSRKLKNSFKKERKWTS